MLATTDDHDELHLAILCECNGRIPALHFHREVSPIAGRLRGELRDALIPETAILMLVARVSIQSRESRDACFHFRPFLRFTLASSYLRARFLYTRTCARTHVRSSRLFCPFKFLPFAHNRLPFSRPSLLASFPSRLSLSLSLSPSFPRTAHFLCIANANAMRVWWCRNYMCAPG